MRKGRASPVCLVHLVCFVYLVIWFVLFIWLDQTHQINQTNKTNQMDQTDQINKQAGGFFSTLMKSAERYLAGLPSGRGCDWLGYRDCTGERMADPN